MEQVNAKNIMNALKSEEVDELIVNLADQNKQKIDY